MRLDHGDDASIAGDAGGAEHSGDLHGMMRVVVIDVHALPFADMGEAALHAGEAGKASTDGVVAHASLGRNGERRKRIQCIVVTERGQHQILEHACATGDARGRVLLRRSSR